MFDVYTKDFKKVTIPYIDYLNSKVCASEYVDYKNNEIKPNGQGMVEVKYRMKRVMVPVDEVDLVDLHPDYRLSQVMRRIPLINYTDSSFLNMESLKTFNCWKRFKMISNQHPSMFLIYIGSTTIVSLK